MTHLHTQFGIDEVYIHDGLDYELLEKLYRRAELSLDGEDSFVLKYSPPDMVLVSHQRIPSSTMVHRFLKALDSHPDKTNFIKFNTLLNEDELFSAIKTQSFVLITKRMLIKEVYIP